MLCVDVVSDIFFGGKFLYITLALRGKRVTVLKEEVTMQWLINPLSSSNFHGHICQLTNPRKDWKSHNLLKTTGTVIPTVAEVIQTNEKVKTNLNLSILYAKTYVVTCCIWITKVGSKILLHKFIEIISFWLIENWLVVVYQAEDETATTRQTINTAGILKINNTLLPKFFCKVGCVAGRRDKLNGSVTSINAPKT